MFTRPALWAAAAFCLGRPVHAQTIVRRTSELNTVGTATRYVRPDLATLSIDFSAVGASPLDAGLNVAARADSLRHAFQALGIPRDSLISGNRWYWWRGRVEMVLGPERYLPLRAGERNEQMVRDTTYRAYDAIELHIRNLSKVGEAIDSALAHGILAISSLTFSASNTMAERTAALRDATSYARAQAQAIAEAGGTRLGRIISLGTSAPQRAYFEEASVTTSGSSAEFGNGQGGTQVIHELIPVTVAVYATWELQSQ